MAKYRILSMDGGGVRGVLTARFLEKIADRHPDFVPKADLIAGTSAGSINAVGLAVGLTPARLVELYHTQSSVIFHDTVWHDIGDLWGLAGAKYTTDGRYNAIHPYFGDAKLGEIQKKLLVAAFELDSENQISPSKKPQRSWKAKFFHNFPRDNDGSPNPDLDQKATDVVMRSSAAPTYFPIHQGFVDGGVIANNPSICALAQALNVNTGQQPDTQSIALLSVGTGSKPKYLKSRDGNWGLTQWGFNLVDMLLDTGSDLADYQCRQLLADCYRRLDAMLQENIGLDATDQIEPLIAIADEMADSGQLQPYYDWIEQYWLPD
jgi:patatin-like phospholipase/acyl hydrolase